MARKAKFELYVMRGTVCDYQESFEGTFKAAERHALAIVDLAVHCDSIDIHRWTEDRDGRPTVGKEPVCVVWRMATRLEG